MKNMFDKTLTLLEKGRNNFVWATAEEISAYIREGYEIVNPKKLKAWEKFNRAERK